MELKQSEIAELFSTSGRQVRRWEASGCPRLSNGRYDLKAVIAWWQQCHEEQVEELSTGDGAGKSVELERLRKANANLAELKLERQRGELLSVSEMKQKLGRLVTILQHLGRELRTAYGDDCYARMEAAVDRFGKEAEEL